MFRHNKLKLYIFLRKKRIWKQWAAICRRNRRSKIVKNSLVDIFDKRSHLKLEGHKTISKRSSLSDLEVRDFSTHNKGSFVYKSELNNLKGHSSCRNKDTVFTQWKLEFHRRNKLQELINTKVPLMIKNQALKSIRMFANERANDQIRNQLLLIHRDFT